MNWPNNHPERSGLICRPSRPTLVARAMGALAAAMLLIVTLFPGLIESKAAEFSEYQVKAAFLLNFTRYVDWPKSSFAKADSPLVICILGQDRFGEDLRTLIADKSIEGRKLVLHKVDTIEQCRGCQILFVSQSEKFR